MKKFPSYLSTKIAMGQTKYSERLNLSWSKWSKWQMTIIRNKIKWLQIERNETQKRKLKLLSNCIYDYFKWILTNNIWMITLHKSLVSFVFINLIASNYKFNG